MQRGDVFLVNLSTRRLLQHLGSLPPERLEEIRTALDRHLWF